VSPVERWLAHRLGTRLRSARELLTQKSSNRGLRPDRWKVRMGRVIFSIILLATHGALGGIGTISGRESDLWTDYHCSVVLARVGDIVELKHELDNGTHRAKLQPLATLAGILDPGASPTLDVRFYSGTNTSSIGRAPAKGDLVIAVVVIGRRHGEEKQPSDWVTSDLCTFMPDDSALVAVDGLGDPRILQTIDRIRDARAHSEPRPTTSGKSQP
jgi:hypothetical protein